MEKQFVSPKNKEEDELLFSKVDTRSPHQTKGKRCPACGALMKRVLIDGKKLLRCPECDQVDDL